MIGIRQAAVRKSRMARVNSAGLSILEICPAPGSSTKCEPEKLLVQLARMAAGVVPSFSPTTNKTGRVTVVTADA